jgi:hypothetical protein
MKQHEAVIESMKANGGYATLGQLYQTALKVPNCEWGTKTPFASIRRIVQTHPGFFKIRPRLWALESERASVLKHLGLETQSKPLQVAKFDHTFYQGLIAEIGNLKGYETFIPNQDKNKPYPNHKLSDVATVRDFYLFTYESLLRRAKTVDVSWFNERKLPRAFFEVEHSTNIYNSLLKFLEFQDFRIEFFVVASAARHSEFNDRILSSAFKPIRAEVKFCDYDAISDMHSKLAGDRVLQELSRL